MLHLCPSPLPGVRLAPCFAFLRTRAAERNRPRFPRPLGLQGLSADFRTTPGLIFFYSHSGWEFSDLTQGLRLFLRPGSISSRRPGGRRTLGFWDSGTLPTGANPACGHEREGPHHTAAPVFERSCCAQLSLRRIAPAMAIKPMPNNPSVPGSGVFRRVSPRWMLPW